MECITTEVLLHAAGCAAVQGHAASRMLHGHRQTIQTLQPSQPLRTGCGALRGCKYLPARSYQVQAKSGVRLLVTKR